jgi:photosystem II stability/assembly factor-like uncharacterized protein
MARAVAALFLLAVFVSGCAADRFAEQGGAMTAVAPTPAAKPKAKPLRVSEMYADSVAFFDETTGLLGWQSQRHHGRFDPGSGLSRSTDGGVTWKRVRHFDGPFALAVQGETAWAAVQCDHDRPRCATTKLWRSDDRGKTWSKVGSVPVGTVSFVDEEHGFGAGDGVLFETFDGGRTWKPRRFDPPCPKRIPEVVSVSFPTANHGWALCGGEPATALGPKAVSETADGGRAWSIVAAAYLPPGVREDIGRIDSLGHAGEIAFTSSGDGLMTTSRGLQYASHDGGVTWEPMRPFEPELDFGASSTFVSGSAYMISLGGGKWRTKLWRTTDNGRSWRLVARFGRF